MQCVPSREKQTPKYIFSAYKVALGQGQFMSYIKLLTDLAALMV